MKTSPEDHLSTEERLFFNKVVEQLQNTRRTFTESTALQALWDEHIHLALRFDRRFVKVEQGNRQLEPHYRLRAHKLANPQLFKDLLDGTWDGLELDEKLAALDAEEGGWHVFYPHDADLINRQGRWVPAREKNPVLTPEQKNELDQLLPALIQAWESTGYQPWIIQHMLEALTQAGWSGASLSNSQLIVRSWLLQTKEILRVGQDFWLPAAQLPTEVKRSRLQVLPIRQIMPAKSEDTETEIEPVLTSPENPGNDYQYQAPLSADAVIPESEIIKKSTPWKTSPLLTVNLLEGFFTIPPERRAFYPPPALQEHERVVFRARWYEDGELFWLWLDRQQHRLYGPDLLRKIEWCAPGDVLRVEWSPEYITLDIVKHLNQIQQEEMRLIDPEALKKLRGKRGESYRQSIQVILTTAPDGLTWHEIIEALSQRQLHMVNRRTVLALLYGGRFIQRGQRWFAAPDNAASTRSLRTAIMETLLPQSQIEAESTQPLSLAEYTRTRAQAIEQRLTSISRKL